MHRLLVLFFLLSACSFSAIKDKNYGSVVVDEVISIYDGDTFRANIKNWPAVVGERVPVRISGIDTPELKARCDREKTLARKAKQHTVAMLRAGKRIEIRSIKRDKYFRLLGDVYVDDKNLGASLVKAGLAVPYEGGTKKNWCRTF